MATPEEIQLGEKHLVRVYKKFKPIVKLHSPCILQTVTRTKPNQRFAALARSITHQQLAGKAAESIHARFVSTVGEVTPVHILDAGFDALRASGLSGSKANSILDLSEKTLDGTVSFERINRLPNEEVIEQLIVVRGIGRWTAEMFLMFQLGRIDVWPIDDYGVRKGWAVLHDMPDLPSPKELHALGEAGAPYRSIAAWYCWRAADAAPNKKKSKAVDA